LLQYVIAGLVLGGIYSLAASGLVITYVSAGILNFAFGSLAYVVARMFYWLHVQKDWPLLPSVLVCMFVVGPALGAFLYAILFRMLMLASTLIKVVITIGLSTALPPLATLVFEDISIVQAPGVAPEPVRVFHVLGSALSMNQLIVYIAVAAILIIGALILRFTDAGLSVRAMVDSPAMTSLSGSNPGRVSLAVWMVSTFLAGVCGLLVAPIIGLTPGGFTLLIAAAFAAVIAAKLRNLGTAIAVAFAMGVASTLLQYFMPADSSLTAAILPSVPFAFIVLFLAYHMIRGGRVSESEGVGGALDRAILPNGGSKLAASAENAVAAPIHPSVQRFGPLVLFALVCLLPLVLHTFWMGLMAQAVALAIVLLSYTLVTGEGGMLWLSQITFAGVGALFSSQLASNHGWPIVPAILVSALAASLMGVALGFATLRLGDLYVALVTLTAGLLMEGLVFTRPMFQQLGIGVVMPRPGWADTDKAFVYLGLAVIAVISLLIVNVRRATTGMALNAVRWSETGARTIGISVVQMKLIAAGIAAFIAAVGGAFMAMQTRVALAENFSTFFGLVLLTVVVTFGVRSCVAAVMAGMLFAMSPQLLQEYLSPTFIQLTPIFFGVGAIQLAKHPEGVMVDNAHQMGRNISRLVRLVTRSSGGGAGGGTGGAEETRVPEPVGAVHP
jgi:branched-chain amino acid transport system permease protein